MSERNSPPLPSPAAFERRRSSFAGSFTDLFNRSPAGINPNGSQPQTQNQNQGTAAYPGPITTAAAQAQRRRLSLTTVGLSGSPNQTTPFNGARGRRGSVSTASSGSVDESPFEDELASAPPAGNPTTPFGRRLSFGARALRDVRNGNGSVGNGNGEGFSFTENARSRAERASMSAASGTQAAQRAGNNGRHKSVAIMEPPVSEMPKSAKAPDAFQERILKGDFYMD